MPAHLEPTAARSLSRPGRPGKHGPGGQSLALIVLLGASAVVAALGGLATANNVQGWYAAADKAPWSPPNWLFGPVWTVLYVAMAVAAWLVWRSGARGTRTALITYALQLVRTSCGLRCSLACTRRWVHPRCGSVSASSRPWRSP